MFAHARPNYHISSLATWGLNGASPAPSTPMPTFRVWLTGKGSNPGAQGALWLLPTLAIVRGGDNPTGAITSALQQTVGDAG